MKIEIQNSKTETRKQWIRRGGATNNCASKTFKNVVWRSWSRNLPLLWWRKARLDGLEAVIHFLHQLLQFIESLGDGALIIV